MTNFQKYFQLLSGTLNGSEGMFRVEFGSGSPEVVRAQTELLDLGLLEHVPNTTLKRVRTSARGVEVLRKHLSTYAD